MMLYKCMHLHIHVAKVCVAYMFRGASLIQYHPLLMTTYASWICVDMMCTLHVKRNGV